MSIVNDKVGFMTETEGCLNIYNMMYVINYIHEIKEKNGMIIQ